MKGFHQFDDYESPVCSGCGRAKHPGSCSDPLYIGSRTGRFTVSLCPICRRNRHADHEVCFKRVPSVEDYRRLRELTRQLNYDYVVWEDGTVHTNKEINEMAVMPNYDFERDEPRDTDFTRRIKELKRQQEALAEEQRFLETLPDEPHSQNDVTPVVYWEKQFAGGGKTYQYVAIKCRDGLWYTSGPKAPKGYIWGELLLWLMETDPQKKLPELRYSNIEDWSTLAASGEA